MKVKFFVCDGVRAGLLWLICLCLLVGKIYTEGNCASFGVSPKSLSDCLPYSNSTDFCCFLNATESPSAFTSCIWVNSKNVFSVITVGNMKYKVDCHGIKNYETYFPFEDQYTACGEQNPMTASDCGRFNSETASCCLSSTKPDFDLNSNPLCYYYPNNPNFTTMNYTEVNKNGVNLYFACDACRIKTTFSFCLIIFSLLFFMLS